MKQFMGFILCILFFVACTPAETAEPVVVNATREAKETITPSPSPLPSATPIPPATAAATLPAIPPPAPPPFWKPEPDINPNNYDGESHQAILALVNWAQGDPTLIEAQMASWGTFPSIPGSEGIPHVWAEAADLDNDGTLELLVSMPRLVEECSEAGCTSVIACDVPDCPAHLFLFESNGSHFVLVHQFGHFSSLGGFYVTCQPELFPLTDLNQDGQIDIMIKAGDCRADWYYTEVVLGNWDGRQWQGIGPFGLEDSQVTLVDWNGDGSMDINMYGGMVWWVEAGLQRPFTNIFGWQDGEFQLLFRQPDPSNHPYHWLLDAHAALEANDLDLAYTLASQVLNPPADANTSFMNERSAPRIRAFAAINLMLIHALRGEAAEIETLLHYIETETNTADNPYVAAAQAFWQTYQETDEPLEACEGMANVIRLADENAQFIREADYNIDYNIEGMTMLDVCALSTSNWYTPQP